MFSRSACGNKVSPASLLNSNECSIDTGIMSCGESQLSQMSLFSSSEPTNSLELFSQPPSLSQGNPSKALCEPPGGLKSVEQKVPDGKKYYTKYLSSVSSLSKHKLSTKDDRSIPASHTENTAGKMSFLPWKEMQQDKFDIKCLMDDVRSSMKGIAKETITIVKEDLQTIISGVQEREEKFMEERARYVDQMGQVVKEQEETKKTLIELRSEVIQQRALLERVEHQLSSISSMPAEAVACYTEKILAQLQEVAAAKPPPTSTAHVGTQTLVSAGNSPEGSGRNIPCSDEVLTDQSVPSVLQTIPASNTEDEKLFGEGGESEDKWLSCQWQHQQEMLQQRPHSGQNQSHHHYHHQSQLQRQQQPLPLFGSQASCSGSYSEPPTRSGGSINRTRVSVDLDPSPVYDLDLTRLPMVIEKETCDSVRIERKVVYGKRHLVDRSPFGPNKSKLPRKTLAITSSSKRIDNDFTMKRRSKRNMKKVPSYCYSSSEGEEQEEQVACRQSSSRLQFKPAPGPPSSKLRRKVSSHCQDSGRLVSHRNSAGSQGNDFDDAFFSGSLAVLQSSARLKDKSKGNLQKGKFNRTNESVKRRLKVISNMSGAGMELRQLENSILNSHLRITDSSP